MPQSDGISTLQRMEFSHSKGSYKFNINPQNISMSQPHRSSVIKTQSNYVIDDFNSDVQTIKISGTTGSSRGAKGEKAIMNLWTFLDSYENQTPNYGQSPREPLDFYNHTENYAFSTVLSPEGYTISRDVSHPLWWYYEINLIVLGYAGQVIDPSTISGAEVTSRDTNKNDDNRQTIIGPMPNSNYVSKGNGYKEGTQSSNSNMGTKGANESTHSSPLGGKPVNPITGKPYNSGSELSNWSKNR